MAPVPIIAPRIPNLESDDEGYTRRIAQPDRLAPSPVEREVCAYSAKPKGGNDNGRARRSARRLAEMERKREIIRVRRLISYCDDWRAAADIRAFVAAAEPSSLVSAETEKFASWKSWALDHAAQIDPLRNGDLFDRKVDDYEVYSLRD